MKNKRFIVETVEITDCCTGESRIEKVITDTRELYSYDDLYELCDDINKLADENEQLRQTIIEMQQDEELYANEIVKLNKEAKEVLNFKNLGGDY